MNIDSCDQVGPRVYAPDFVHLLRTTQQMQYTLSQMAEQKAGLLTATTFVICTITAGQLKDPGGPPLAMLILGGAAIISAVLAVLAVMPSVKAPPRADGPANILFFGSFSQLDEDEFVEILLKAVQTHQSLFEAFAHDIYQNGCVLARKKYKLIGYAYRTLLIGLAGSAIAFVLHLAIGFG